MAKSFTPTNPVPDSFLQVKLLTAEATPPVRGSEHAAGLDLFAALGDRRIVMNVGERVAVPTGIAIAFSPGFYARIAPRSGLSVSNGVATLAGVVDADYRGEIRVILQNHGTSAVIIRQGMKVAQLILEKIGMPVVELVGELPETARGANGFGSTGDGTGNNGHSGDGPIMSGSLTV